MNRPCGWPGCPAIVARGVGYCPRHAAKGHQQAAADTRQYDASRDPRAVAFYRSHEWQRTRAAVLADDPVCRDCRARFAQAVDHIVPLMVDWSRRLDRTNLQGLCWSCHNRKTAKERSGRPPRGDIGDDRRPDGPALGTPVLGLETRVRQGDVANGRKGRG